MMHDEDGVAQRPARVMDLPTGRRPQRQVPRPGPGRDLPATQLQCCNDGSNQRFRVDLAPSTPIYTTTGLGGPSPRKCVDVDASGNVQQWDCWYGQNQRFVYTKFANGREIRALHSGKCLTVAGAGDTNGTRIVEAACTGAVEQRFSIRSTGEIRPSFIDKCFDRDGVQNANNGALLQLWACHGSENQRFEISTDQ